MSQTQFAPLVAKFAGENRLLPDDLLPPNVAVEGQNVDYSRGTIKKRLGIPKTHSEAYVKGGIRITNAANNRGLVILDQTYLDLAGDFTLEIIVRIESDPTGWTAGAAEIISKRSATDGWILRYRNTTTDWAFLKADSAGGASFTTITVPGDLDSGTHPVVGESYHIAVWRTGTSMQMQITRGSDGETGTSAAGTCDGDTNNTRNVFVGATFGATPGNITADFTVDELRMWSDQRSTTELSDCMFRELTESEQTDAELIGYWPMNDASTTLTEDLSINNNPAMLSSAAPAFVPSIMPNPSTSNTALQGNGIDAYATAPYNSEYAPILNTGDDWEVQFWARLDTSVEWPNNAVLCQLGSTTTGNGHVFSVYIVWPGSGAAPLLKYSFSTTTTNNNVEVTPATAFNPEPGVPFHVRLVRFGTTITLIVNGVVIDTETAAAENGPTSSTSYGMTFLARNSAGTYSLLAPCTIDEVRLFISSTYGNALMNTELTFVTDTNLVGYWRFNANSPLNDEASSSDAVLVPATEDKPSRTYGCVYPSDPTQTIKLIGPVATPVTASSTTAQSVVQGQPLFRREFLIATKEAFFSQQNTSVNWLKNLDTPGSDTLYSFCRFKGCVVCCNGVGRNYVYNGTGVPASLTLPTDTDVPTATPTGAGGAWPASPGTGNYSYRFTWYNETLDIEGPYWGTVTAAVVEGTHDSVAIASVPTAATMSTAGFSTEVTHWRLYRLDTGATVYRRLATVAIGTTTYSDTGTSVTANTALHTGRTHLDPQNVAEVYNNRLFLARGSSLVFSDADTFDFTSTSVIFVDRDDGEAITGLKTYQGQLIVWKKTSIYVLDGDGPTTFQLRKIISGIGCLSPHTVAASPEGVYFLGLDGVYLYNGGRCEYISHSQQPLFQRLVHDTGYLACGTYHPETHQYYVSFDALSEGTFERSAPAREAIDEPTLATLFTHYYRLKNGADSKGTGGTIADASVTFAADAERGLVLVETGDWTASITSQTAASSDFTFGFWVKNPNQINLNDCIALDGSLDPAVHFQLYPFALLQNNAIFLNVTEDFDADPTIVQSHFPQTKWHHVAYTRRGTQCTLYINGKATSVGTSTPGSVFTTMGAVGGGGHNTPDAYLDNIFWVKDLALTSAQIREIYEYETTEQVIEHHTMVFDEETKTWARHDKRFDYLTTAEYSSRTAEAIGALNGFVCRIGEADGDLHISDGDTAFVYTRSGSLSAVTGLKITDSAATFPTTKNGYAGARAVFVPTDTTKETQYRTILSNTATVMYLDAPLVESFTGTYYIGPIELVWESPMMAIDSPTLTKVIQYLQLWQTEVSSGTFSVYYRTDFDETYQNISVATDDDFVRMTMRTRGRRVKLRIYHLATDKRMEINSFQLQYQTRGVVA